MKGWKMEFGKLADGSWGIITREMGVADVKRLPKTFSKTFHIQNCEVTVRVNVSYPAVSILLSEPCYKRAAQIAKLVEIWLALQRPFRFDFVPITT